MFVGPLFLHTCLISLVLAVPGAVNLGSRGTSSSNSSVCDGNTASNRSVWCDYDTSTNYYTTGPDTGVTVEYYWELQNVTLSPNGVSRTYLTVNGTVPGPTIEANWGDTIVIHVKNNFEINGTTIHFHGVRQNWTNPSDGVPSVTQCPTASGDTVTYTFKATQYGSSWYHSHYSMQAWDGVFGGIVIHGPATANYDHDLGTLLVTDWDHLTASQMYSFVQYEGPPTLDSGLINGTNMNGTLGSYWETSFDSGSSYLIRVVNGAIDTHFDFSIDNHTLNVIAADWVPIVPYATDYISIGIGQRYDVIVTANQSSVASDFWLRAIPDTFCSNNYNPDLIRGIIHYGSSTSTPTTSVHTITDNDCLGEPSASIVPYVSLTASSAGTVSVEDEVTVDVGDITTGVLTKWYLGNTTFDVDWRDPTALIVVNNGTSYNSSYAVTEVPTADEWVTLIIESSFPVPHPIHLHGHDFFILAYGTGTYSSSGTTLNTNNPPRRDVQMLPAGGYLVLAFQADNPGVWLAHCQACVPMLTEPTNSIGWHTDEGFALQFVERYDEIAALYNATELQSSCESWDTFQSSIDLVQIDDGI